jgi:hypothetical protein
MTTLLRASAFRSRDGHRSVDLCFDHPLVAKLLICTVNAGVQQGGVRAPARAGQI